MSLGCRGRSLSCKSIKCATLVGREICCSWGKWREKEGTKKKKRIKKRKGKRPLMSKLMECPWLCSRPLKCCVLQETGRYFLWHLLRFVACYLVEIFSISKSKYKAYMLRTQLLPILKSYKKIHSYSLVFLFFKWNTPSIPYLHIILIFLFIVFGVFSNLPRLLNSNTLQ